MSSCCGPPSYLLSRLCSSPISSQTNITAWWDISKSSQTGFPWMLMCLMIVNDEMRISHCKLMQELYADNVTLKWNTIEKDINVSTGMLKHLSSVSVLSCGFSSSTAGEKYNPVCGCSRLQTPFTPKQWKLKIHFQEMTKKGKHQVIITFLSKKALGIASKKM